MSFLQLWPIYVGAAALALPVAIHFLTRPRPERMPLSTLRMVREIVFQQRSRHRLRDALILGTRMLAIGLLAFALARPLIGERPLVTPGEEGTSARVVILDVSQSMAAGGQGVGALERARGVAADYLAYAPGLRANLIEAAVRSCATFEGLSTNFVALRDELARLQVRPERLNVAAALEQASKLLATAAGDSANRLELVVVSDFQRTNWSAADFSVLPAGTRIELESVAPRETPVNMAITRAQFAGRGNQDSGVRLEVEVGNFSLHARRVTVEVVLGQGAFRLTGDCPAGSRTILAEDVPTHDLGWQSGTARLIDVDDALPQDNQRPLVLEVRTPPVYALLTSQRRSGAPTASFYLERALAPLAGRGSERTARVRRIDPEKFDSEAAAGAELLVLDHPGPLPAEKLQLLAGMLRRGRGLLYLACQPADATNLQRLADLVGSNLQLPVEFAAVPAIQHRAPLQLTSVKREQMPFAVFGDAVADNLSGLRFTGTLASHRHENALEDDLLASYSDRSAALVITSTGAGMLGVWNVDLANSNLPASTAFVPLVNELAARLIEPGRQQPAAECGEALAVYLPAEAGPPAGLSLQSPPGAENDAGELVTESLGTLWRSAALGSPGIYRVVRDDRPVYSLACQLPTEESDLTALDESLLRGRLAGGRQVHLSSADAARQPRDDTWAWLLVGVAVALLAEIGLLRWFKT